MHDCHGILRSLSPPVREVLLIPPLPPYVGPVWSQTGRKVLQCTSVKTSNHRQWLQIERYRLFSVTSVRYFAVANLSVLNLKPAVLRVTGVRDDIDAPQTICE